MDTARIAALLEPFVAPSSLDETQLNQISIYIDLLQRWNARINLTAIRNQEEIVTRHFGESFFLARHLFPGGAERGGSEAQASGAEQSAAGSTENWELRTENWVPRTENRVLDIGSGAGFPALPLKIWAPSIRLTLVESNHKKATFLREAARALTLTDINVITERAETLAKEIEAPPDNYPDTTRPGIARPDRARPDIVTLRAVEHFESILHTAATLLPPAGRLAILIGTSQLPHLTTLPTVAWNNPIHVPQSHSRELLIGTQNESGRPVHT
jgi:16S rRNA (guanine527-N7)-methyltransferase